METQALLFAHRNMNKAYYEEENYITTSSGKETKDMKKFVIGLILMITMVLTMVTAMGDDNYLENYFPDTADVRDAYEKGTPISSEMYYYRCAIYSAHANLNVTEIFGHNNVAIEEIEQYIENSLKNAGMLHPTATITKIGMVNEKPIYRFEIGCINDMNKNIGGNVGNAFIGEGMPYNLMVFIGQIV